MARPLSSSAGAAERYRGVLFDNIGMFVPLICDLRRHTFTATSVDTSACFTWEVSEASAVRFTNEQKIDGGPRTLSEEAVITPSVTG